MMTTQMATEDKLDRAQCQTCCRRTTPTEGWVCDWQGCWAVVCGRCHAGGVTATWWCGKHRPVRVRLLAPLRWVSRESLMHPGRSGRPSEQDEVGRLRADVVPSERAAVMARTVGEDHRRKVLARAREFAGWYNAQTEARRLRWGRAGAVVMGEFIHEKLRRAVQLSGRGRVESPTTPGQWVRLLGSAFEEAAKAAREAELRRQIDGYLALAPGPKEVERGVRDRWIAARSEVEGALVGEAKRGRGVPTGRPGEQISKWAGPLFVCLAVQMQGGRPLEALRACLPQARWMRVSGPKEVSTKATSPEVSRAVWKVGVWVTKTNKLGQTRAWTWWRLPETRFMTQARLSLPVSYDKQKELCAARKELLARHGVRTTYSARRDALTLLEEKGGDPGKAAAHRPGSRRTLEYVNSTIPTNTQVQMMRLTESGF